jgi:hypothetical protein
MHVWITERLWLYPLAFVCVIINVALQAIPVCWFGDSLGLIFRGRLPSLCP